MDINIFSIQNSDRRAGVKRHLLTLLTAIVLNLLYWYFQGSDMQAEGDGQGIGAILAELFTTVVETVILMESSFAVSRLVIRLFWRVKYSFTSLLFQNLILLISVVMISAAISLSYAALFPDADWLSWDVFLCDCLIAYFLTSVFFMSYLTNRYMKEKALAQQVTIDKLKLKTDNHFVFNSLATLGTLIRTDPEAAVEFNASMSRMYRYIVQKGDAIVVSLSEELNFMKEYIHNQSVRHTNVTINIDDKLRNMNSFIPPLTLQGLVENAMNHNGHGPESPLVIDLGTDGTMIIVSNNKQKLPMPMESSKSGLQTLEMRYRTIVGKGIEVIDTEDRFEVRLPIVRHTDIIA